MIASVWDAVVALVQKLGYPGIFLALVAEGMGLPFPGDAALAFFGFLSSAKQFDLGYVVLIASLGSGTGSLIAFALGKVYGLPLLTRYGKYLLISDHSIQLTTQFTKKYGPLVLLLGRLLPGVRTLSSYVAGVGNMSWLAFTVYSFAGFFLFCTFWIGAGYLLGENWRLVVLMLKDYLVGAAIAVILLGGSIYIWRKLRLR
ncbi:DedA family protein [Brevibacillus massiliensis]|uniref:DedA family protein n=1 Tax=Brevibacillus massiliensis TaxID=1118054 RepID=UPI000304FAD5|nr:DedA family protein [Brevibacillus massiliensis]